MTDTKLLPSNPDLEKAVLGALMVFPDTIPDVTEALPPEAFYVPANRNLFQAIVSLHSRGKPVDRYSVVETLRQMGKIEEVGGIVGVICLEDEVATAANVQYQAKLLRDYWVRRVIISRTEQIRDRAFGDDADADDLLNDLQTAGTDLLKSEGNLTSITEAAHEAVDRIGWASEHPGEIAGFPTGIKKLDQMLNGIERANYYIIGARPSEGKTALGLEIARSSCTKTPVLVVSREMPAHSLVARMIARDTGVNSQALRLGNISGDAWGEVARATTGIQGREIHFDETSRTADDVRAAVRRAKQKYDVGLVVVDYLQLLGNIRGEKYGSRDEGVTARSRLMKQIALEQNVAIVVLAQLNRQVEGRPDRRPQLHDLRESGAIEQDADTVLMLYHPNKENPQDNSLEIWVRKQRNGPVGKVLAYFDAETGAIGEWCDRRDCA